MKRIHLTKWRRFGITAALAIFLLSVARGDGQELSAPLGAPQPGPVTDGPYAPQPILPGGIVVTLYPPTSNLLNADRIGEAEKYNMTRGTPGRIQSIVNIHNPSIEVHTVGPGINTGAAVILAAGGGHRTLNVGKRPSGP
jgi:endo-1,4-beta-xylanase